MLKETINYDTYDNSFRLTVENSYTSSYNQTHKSQRKTNTQKILPAYINPTKKKKKIVSSVVFSFHVNTFSTSTVLKAPTVPRKTHQNERLQHKKKKITRARKFMG